MDDIQQIVAVARDIVFLVLVMVVLLMVLVLYRKVAGVLNSARRTLEDTEEIVSTVSTRLVGPAAAGSGVAFGVGKLASFLFGLNRKRKDKGRDGRRRDRQESRDGGRNNGG